MNATKNALARAYIRVSHVGKDRADTLMSDKMQLDEAKRYAEFAELRFDEEESKRCADLDVSGFRKPWRQRPGLMRLYADAKQGKFQVLIFYKISRLARNVREALDLIDAFEKLGVSFHFVAERIDSSSAQGRFLRNVLLSAAEMQSEDTSAFLKAVCQRRAREGKVMGALPAWIERDDLGTFQVREDQRLAFRRMIELRTQGLGYVRIAQALNREGFRTGTGKHWTDAMTYKYLQLNWIRTMLGSGFYGRNTPDQQEIAGAYPPIITVHEADQLIALQKLYSEDFGRKPVSGLDWQVSKRRKSGRYSADSIHLLSSIIFCPYCGARMIATQRVMDGRTTPFVYRCPRYRTRAEDHHRGLNSVAANQVEDAVLRVVRMALQMPPAKDIEPLPSPARNPKTLDQLQTKIDRLLAMHLDGQVDEADFRRLYTDLVEQRNRELRHAQSPTGGEQLIALQLASSLQPSREELRQLVLLVVQRIESPLTSPVWKVRSDRQTLRRFARVTLRFPATNGVSAYDAGLYMENFTGEREARPSALTTFRQSL